MAYENNDLLEVTILKAIEQARRQGKLEVALALAMAHEILTRDRSVSTRQSYWPLEIKSQL